MGTVENKQIPWFDDEFPKSTSLPDIIAEETNTTVTLIIIIVSAIFLITLLFLVAVFIDCRQEKLAQLSKPRHKGKFGVPKFGKRDEEEEGFANKMHLPVSAPSTSAVIV